MCDKFYDRPLFHSRINAKEGAIIPIGITEVPLTHKSLHFGAKTAMARLSQLHMPEVLH